MTRKTELVQFLEDTMDREERIRILIGPQVLQGAKVSQIQTHASKGDTREAVHVGIELDQAQELDYIAGLAREQVPFPVIFSTHVVPDCFLGGTWATGMGGIGFTITFPQDSHPDQVDHELEQERRYRKMQEDAGIPTFLHRTTLNDKRGER